MRYEWEGGAACWCIAQRLRVRYITPPSALAAVKALICWVVGGCGLAWLLLWRVALAKVVRGQAMEKAPSGPWPLVGGLSGVGLLVL